MNAGPALADPSHALDMSRRAADRVVERYAGGVVAVSDPRHVRRQLEDLLEALERTLTGGRPDAIAAGPLDPLALLRSLRTEIVRSWPEGAQGLPMLMRAFEVVQEALPEAHYDAVIGGALTPFARELLREISHLLRSPLGSIVMMADMLGSELLGPLTEAQERQVRIIQRAALGITCTATDLLTLCGERDGIRRIEPFVIDDLVTMVGDVLEPVALSKGRSIVVRVDAGGRREGPLLALREIILGLGLRAALSGEGGEVALTAIEEGRDAVRFAVESRPGADASMSAEGHEVAFPDGPAAGGRIIKVLRIDDETRDFTVSPDGLGVSVAGRIVHRLGAELERNGVGGSAGRLSFRVELPRA